MLVKDNYDNLSENSTLVQSITSSFENLEENQARQLVNLIETNDSDFLCEENVIETGHSHPKRHNQ